MLDRRCKYKLRQVHEFYLFVRDKRNRIFYVKFKENNKVLSTGETDIQKAYEIALKLRDSCQNLPKKRENPHNLRDILTNYYTKDSVYVQYDTQHGSRYTDATLTFNCNRMKIVAELLGDMERPEQITRKRLLQLQEQLLDKGLSGKTVNNYFSTLHKIFVQLLDKEIILNDPFANLRPCSYEKEMRLCFPLESIKGCFGDLKNKYDVLSFIACATGMRRGEIERIEKEDVIEKKGRKWLKVRGTKSVYSVREVPINDYIENAVMQFLTHNYTPFDWRKAVVHTAEKIGFDEKYVEENHIVFHSFRKLYKTLLTQANLNTSLVEMLMGHSTQNQKSNDVERIYFVAESADLSLVHDKVLEVLEYLV